MSRKTSETTSQTTGMVSARRVRICFMARVNDKSGVRDQWSVVTDRQQPKLSSFGRRLLFHRLNANFADAAAFHLGDGEAAAFKDDAFAGLGDVAEADQKEAGQGFHAAFPRQAPLGLGFQVAQV